MPERFSSSLPSLSDAISTPSNGNISSPISSASVEITEIQMFTYPSMCTFEFRVCYPTQVPSNRFNHSDPGVCLMECAKPAWGVDVSTDGFVPRQLPPIRSTLSPSAVIFINLLKLWFGLGHLWICLKDFGGLMEGRGMRSHLYIQTKDGHLATHDWPVGDVAGHTHWLVSALVGQGVDRLAPV
jgi:hypothetical protein